MALMLLIIMLIVSSAEAALVSPSNINIHRFSSKNGFQSNIHRLNGNLTKIELLQMAAKGGKERLRKIIDPKMGSSSSHVDSHVRELTDGYIMKLSIGTPNPSPFFAIIDTGSNRIWTQCMPCKHCAPQPTPIFVPQKSSSYSKLKCTNNKMMSKACSHPPSHDCTYNATYGDGTFSLGVLATETFTFEGHVSVPKLEFGCGFDNVGTFDSYPAIVGLGRGNSSLVSQMKALKFSYCLPPYGSNQTGLLSVGSLATTPRAAKTTLLIKNQFANTGFYYISLKEITIGNTPLHINTTNFEIKKDGTGGFIVDSGATLTYLERSTFNQVKKELTRQLKHTTLGVSSYLDMELCYNMTSPANRIKFPNITFHFKGHGADFVMTHANYFASVDDNARFGCLMMGASDWVSVFGNFQQQNALLIYDLEKNLLSFLDNTKCTTDN